MVDEFDVVDDPFDGEMPLVTEVEVDKPAPPEYRRPLAPPLVTAAPSRKYPKALAPFIGVMRAIRDVVAPGWPPPHVERTGGRKHAPPPKEIEGLQELSRSLTYDDNADQKFDHGLHGIGTPRRGGPSIG